MKKDCLIINGSCLTMVGGKRCKWMLIRGSEIHDLGLDDSYTKYLDKDTKVIDAKGATVLPGFIDSHFHVVQAALNSTSLDLSNAKTLQEIGEAIADASKSNPKRPIRGIRLDAQNLKEGRLPDRLFLDRYCNDAPVFLNSVEYQTSILNTHALLYYKIPFTLKGVVFDENQMPTGVITNHANVALRERVLRGIPNTQRMDAVEPFLETVIRRGTTTVNAMEGGRLYCDKDAEFIHEYTNKLKIDMALYYQTMDIEKVKSMQLSRIGGSLYIDGTFGARTAALSFEYNDSPGNKGGLNFTQEEINEFVLDCYINKIQLALYTIGDRAIEQAIVAHENALERTGTTGLRHRLEHVELPNKSQIIRAKELGLVFSMSPAYESIWGGPGRMYEERLGDNYRVTNPFREILEHGVTICGGSDCDVTPADPLLGIHSAVNHPVEEHRVSVEEAVEMFTVSGAHAIFEEKRKGTLEAGKLADVVVLDQDILKVSKDAIKDIQVSVTIKGGQILYQRM
jgi:hypothetical protein